MTDTRSVVVKSEEDSEYATVIDFEFERVAAKAGELGAAGASADDEGLVVARDGECAAHRSLAESQSPG
ncbi:hypothetical protein [Streptomyces malaysiensis]|uniref:hypothetical protein n=1 Tax=Streptomyces malaysiensis TaxID=92644 RepID=UPI002B31B6DC|nr:hypothetical protein R8789_22910 [Streptomyces malaysiensis]